MVCNNRITDSYLSRTQISNYQVDTIVKTVSSSERAECPLGAQAQKWMAIASLHASVGVGIHPSVGAGAGVVDYRQLRTPSRNQRSSIFGASVWRGQDGVDPWILPESDDHGEAEDKDESLVNVMSDVGNDHGEAEDKDESLLNVMSDVGDDHGEAEDKDESLLNVMSDVGGGVECECLGGVGADVSG